MNRFRVVLVDPRFAANIGFAARVCMNFGVTDYRGVSRDPSRWHWDEAKKIAVPPADRLLENFRVHGSVNDAISDCDLVIGLTRRFGEILPEGTHLMPWRFGVSRTGGHGNVSINSRF